MNAEQIRQLKKINAAAAANAKPEMSALTLRIVLAGATVVGLVTGMAVIVKAAGL